MAKAKFAERIDIPGMCVRVRVCVRVCVCVCERESERERERIHSHISSPRIQELTTLPLAASAPQR